MSKKARSNPPCVICDKPSTGQPVTIAIGPDTRVLFLCVEHCVPIQEAFDAASDGPTNGATPTPPRGHAVVAIEDWKP